MKKTKKIAFRLILVFVCMITACLTACASGNHTDDSNGTESAYKIWLDNGHTGSEAEFLAWLSDDGVSGGITIGSVEINEDGEFVVKDSNGNVLFKKSMPLCEHTYSGVETGLEATCTSAGYRWKECTKCGDKEYEILSATEHEWDKGTVITRADCVHDGFAYYTCTKCGATQMYTDDATGEHRFENGVCIGCKITYAKMLDKTYNNNYGYEYFTSLEKGAGLCGLYDEIDKQVMRFHSETTANAELSDEDYLLPAINYASYGLTVEEAVSVWKTYLDDKPLYYWLSKSLTILDKSIALNVETDYAVGSVRTAYNDALYEIIGEYLTIAEEESAYTVALAYHDAIIGKIDYAYREDGIQPEDAAWAHSIAGVFEERGAVCEGYARAFQLLLNARGIQNVFVTGESRKEKHAWNLVKLDDGEWYWYDLTWDDTPDVYWGTSHTYCCAPDGDFLKTHTVGSSADWGVSFLYDLPARAAAEYDGDEILYYDGFTLDGTDYVVVGYDTVNLSRITTGGKYSIPETVAYGGREFTVVSLINFENGEPSIQSVLSPDIKFVSVFVPKTVVYINENALNGSGKCDLEAIFVDEKNPRFCSQDGVLFSTDLYTLITYPSGRAGTEYSIPDETVYLAKNAFENSRWSIDLQTLRLGKNLRNVGVTNFGDGYPYPDKTHRAYNFIIGEWNYILRMMSGTPKIIVGENPYFKVDGGLLLNSGETVVFAAFFDIEKAEIPETVTEIHPDAFYGCKLLKSIKIPSGVTYLSSIFGDCENLEEVILPEGLRKIDGFMFWGCKSLKTLVIPETVTEIGGRTFYGCSSLESITIPKNVTSIGDGVFENCSSLKEIIIAEGNTTFVMKGRCLVNVETKTLVQAFNDSVIPDDGSVEVIGQYAFHGCDKITEIVIPEGVVSIKAYTFSDCKALETLVLPVSLAQIGKSIFITVTQAQIFYCGTRSQWEEIEKEGTSNEQPDSRNTVYFYSETRPTAQGNFWHYVNGTPTKW
ncbi:MAG: leucine-rich repeat protein [Clostridiales bacterium]|nr:leucine-rich repeat protein [Clostridiales bacterium]